MCVTLTGFGAGSRRVRRHYVGARLVRATASAGTRRVTCVDPTHTTRAHVFKHYSSTGES